MGDDIDNYNLSSQEFVAHTKNVTCLSFGTQSNQVFATGGDDFHVNLWKVGSSVPIRSIRQNKYPIQSLCFDSNDMHLVSGALNGSIKIYDLSRDGALVRKFDCHASINALHYHPHGEFFVSGSVDNTMKVWDVRNKACLQTYNGHTKEITCVRFSPDGKWVASSSKDGQMLFWDLIAGKLITSIKLQPAFVTSFEFNPCELSVAAITSARTVRLWDLETMETTFTTPAESSQVRAIAFSNLGNTMVSSCRDILKLWAIGDSNEGTATRMIDSLDMGWGNRIADMRINDNSQLVAGSFSSNFVGIHSIDLADSVAAGASNSSSSSSEGQMASGPTVVSEKREAKTSTAASAGISSSDKVRGALPPLPQEKASSAPSVAASGKNNRDRAPQLRRLDEQLAQLRDDLQGVKVVAPSALEDKGYKGDARPAVASRYRDPEDEYEDDFYPAESKDGRNSNNNSHSVRSGGAKAGGDGSSSSAMMAQCKEDRESPVEATDDNDNDDDDDELLEAVEEDTTDRPAPEVVWDQGSSADLAASMNESMWQRVSSARGERQPTSGGGGSNALPDLDLEDSKSGEPDGPVSKAALVSMLPPSSFDSHGSNSYGQRAAPPVGAVRSIQSQQQQQQHANVERTPPVVNKAPTPTFAKAKTPTPVVTPTNVRTGLGRENFNSKFGANNIEILVPSGPPPPPAEDPLSVVGSRPVSNRNGAGPYAGRGVESSAPSSGPRGAVGASGPTVAAPASGGNSHLEYRRTDEQIDKLASQGATFMKLLSDRLFALKTLRAFWSHNNVYEALDYLTALSEGLEQLESNLAVLADFFGSADLTRITLDACMHILGVLLKMVLYTGSQSSEHAMKAVFRAATQLGRTFHEVIITTRQGMMVGVNPAAEARMDKCNTCFSVFNKLKVQGERIRRSTVFRPKDGEPSPVAEEVGKYLVIANQHFAH